MYMMMMKRTSLISELTAVMKFDNVVVCLPLSKDVNSPCSKMEPSDLVRYSKLFGIFLLKLADDVESNIISATFKGIPQGFGFLARTSLFGNTCMCASLFVSPDEVTTSTRIKSASTGTLPTKTPGGVSEKIFSC